MMKSRGDRVIILLLSIYMVVFDTTKPSMAQEISEENSEYIKKEVWAFPFVGLLELSDNKNEICTATLLSADILLTAGHCVKYVQGKLPHPAMVFYVYKNKYNREGFRIKKAKSITLNSSLGKKDLAIVQLEEPVPKTMISSYAKIAEKKQQSDYYSLYGFGCLHVNQNGNCERIKRNSLIRNIENQKILTEGDSGGPVFNSDGAIEYINSCRNIHESDCFADPIENIEEIKEIIYEWDQLQGISFGFNYYSLFQKEVQSLIPPLLGVYASLSQQPIFNENGWITQETLRLYQHSEIDYNLYSLSLDFYFGYQWSLIESIKINLLLGGGIFYFYKISQDPSLKNQHLFATTFQSGVELNRNIFSWLGLMVRSEVGLLEGKFNFDWQLIPTFYISGGFKFYF